MKHLKRLKPDEKFGLLKENALFSLRTANRIFDSVLKNGKSKIFGNSNDDSFDIIDEGQVSL